MTEREQFDTFAVAAPVPRSWTFYEAGARGSSGFDVSRLPEGVGWKTLHSPQRGRPFVQAAIPAAKRMKDGEIKTHGTTGMEGVSVVIGPWGQEDAEFATVQISSKALHGGDNVLPMAGPQDLDAATGLAHDLLRDLGYKGQIGDALVARFDSVIDFQNVEAHGRYVAAFADNRPAVRGGRHVMHADETLAQHFAGGMTRLYNKERESLHSAAAKQRSRFEYERKRGRLKTAGMAVVRDLELARLDREARRMFEDSGYDRDVAPVSEWVHKLLTTVPTYDVCAVCAGEIDGVDRWEMDLDLAVATDSWGGPLAGFELKTGCQRPETCGQPIPGFSNATRAGAFAHAVFTRLGLEYDKPHRNTLRTYSKLYELAGVVPDEVELFDPAEDAEVVFLDLHSQEERRRRKTA